MEDNGFVVPVHDSLQKPILMAGCPRKYTITVWTLTAAVVMGMDLYAFIGVGVLLHIVGVFMTKKDSDFFDILILHLKQKDYLEP